MDHWDDGVARQGAASAVRAPGARSGVHIRRLLTHCGLNFEPACLSFHETKRPVRTASAEQVRQPLYASGIGYWKHFERELEPLRRALGDSMERFTDIT